MTVGPRYLQNICRVDKKKEEKTTPIYANTNYPREMKLIRFIMD